MIPEEKLSILRKTGSAAVQDVVDEVRALRAVAKAARAHVSAVIEQGAAGGQSLLTLEEALKENG